MKDIEWIASSYADLLDCPEEVKDSVGYALDLAQQGFIADVAVQMKGDLRDVVEIRAKNDTGDATFRATYTTTIGDTVYVLDVFKKKSKRGVATPK